MRDELGVDVEEQGRPDLRPKQHRDWPIGVLAIVLLLVCTPFGRRLPEVVRTVAFLMLAVLPFFMVPLAWWRFSSARSTPGIRKWRIWIMLVGCVALSLAFILPGLVFLGVLNWLAWSEWTPAFAAVSLLAAAVVGGRVRFPLFIGGLTLGGFVLLFPVGIL